MTEQAAFDVLGYRTIGGGGITNQKIAFIGLLLEAYERKRPVVLPHFLVMDQIERRHQKFDFVDIFEIYPIERFCAQYGIILTNIDFEQLPAGYDQYFWRIHNILHRPRNEAQDKATIFVLDLLKSLEPRVRKAPLTQKIRNAVFNLDPGFVVAQFRIEADWQEHCKTNLNQTAPAEEVNFLEFEEILTKIKNTMPEVRTVYALCDEKALYLTKERMKYLAEFYFGLNIKFKSDYISGSEEKHYTELHLSLIDFELATFADRLIGITRSTFSCLATLEKFAREGRNVQGHHIYNLKGRRLIERTDNGFFWDANSAIEWIRIAGGSDGNMTKASKDY